MNHFDKKIGKVIDELTTHLLKKDCKDIKIEIHKTDELTKLSFNFNVRDKKMLELLEDTLGQERDETLEEYGWELMGENDCSGELNLVGMCMDTFDYKVDGDNVTVYLERKI